MLFGDSVSGNVFAAIGASLAGNDCHLVVTVSRSDSISDLNRDLGFLLNRTTPKLGRNLIIFHILDAVDFVENVACDVLSFDGLAGHKIEDAVFSFYRPTFAFELSVSFTQRFPEQISALQGSGVVVIDV